MLENGSISDTRGHLLLVIGSKVIFESKIYVIHWIYDSAYCEIKIDDHIRLVKLSDLTPLE
jgi:hypothetical protein